MNSNTDNSNNLVNEVLTFVDKSKGLVSTLTQDGLVMVRQAVDGRTFRFSTTDLSEVIKRVDGEGRPFLQLNFQSALKVIITDTLVGFKPKTVAGLDMERIPKVVTTPDLTSVLDAIEDCLSSDTTIPMEVDILKRVYEAILSGGELAGFDLHSERHWLHRLMPARLKGSA